MTKKIKILFVATEYGNGMMPFVASIVNTLSESGHFDVYGVFVSRTKDYKSYLSSQVIEHSIFLKFPTSQLGSYIYKFLPLSVLKAIYQQKKRHQIDVVHYLSVEYTLMIADLFFPFGKSNVYFTVHDLIPHEYETTSLKDTFMQYVITLGNKWHIHQKNNLTTSSHLQVRLLKKKYPTKNIVYTHFPTLVNHLIEQGNEPVKELEGVKNYLLFFGGVDKYKGVDLLYESYNALSMTNKPPLVVAGKGIEYFQTNPQRQIYRINRFIQDEEVRALFTNALGVVYPYRSATMSGVLSLSYYFRKNVLVSQVPFFLENIDENAFTFNLRKADDLTSQLSLFCQKSLELQNDNNFYETSYSKEVLIKDYMNLYCFG